MTIMTTKTTRVVTAKYCQSDTSTEPSAPFDPIESATKKRKIVTATAPMATASAETTAPVSRRDSGTVRVTMAMLLTLLGDCYEPAAHCFSGRSDVPR
jgi:hypothetical protein